MKSLRLLLLCVATLALGSAVAQKISYSVEKIWDNGMHNAFTSIVEFKGEYYISFREGETHIFNSEGEADGKVRILHSKNGKKWHALPLIGKDGYDLRDPKFSITPDGRLMVIIGGSKYQNKKLIERLPHVMFSDDGRTFTKPQPVSIEEAHRTDCDWLWRVTWHNGVGYSISYGRSTPQGRHCTLFSTTDGIHYKHIKTFDIGYPSEATVRFLADGRMAIMVRRDRGDRRCLWGVSCNDTYTEWVWKPVNAFIGGPDFILLESGKIIAGGRTHLASMSKTSLFEVDKSGRFSQIMVLPSGGDTSYPGFLVVGKELWISYYSTHETATASIYLAKIPLSILEAL